MAKPTLEEIADKKVKHYVDKEFVEKIDAKGTKEKHKNKKFKNLSNKDKDELLFKLCLKAGLIRHDMDFE